VMLFIHLKQE